MLVLVLGICLHDVLKAVLPTYAGILFYFIEFSTQLVLAILLRRVKGPGREADNSPPSSAEVPKQWTYNSNPRVCIYGMCRGTFAFYRGTH
jgi:hypothetical protein